MRRQLAGMSQAELAAKVGTDQPHISRIECGKQPALPKTIKKIADALECDVLDIAEFEVPAAPAASAQ